MTDQPDPRLVTRPDLHPHDPAVWAYGEEWLALVETEFPLAEPAPTQTRLNGATKKKERNQT